MNIANVYSENRQFDKAHHYLDLALEIDKENPELLCNKGVFIDLKASLKMHLSYILAPFKKRIIIILQNLTKLFANFL